MRTNNHLLTRPCLKIPRYRMIGTMDVRISLALALVASSAGLTLPTSAAASTVAQSHVDVLALELVELTFATNIIRRDAVKACEDNFRTSFLRHPEARADDARRPGLVDAMVGAGCSKLDETIAALLPELKASTAASYAASLSPAELGDAIAFFLTSAGKKLVAATPAMATGSSLQEILDPTELSRFGKFSRSSAGRKIEALKPRQINDMTIAMNRAMTAAFPLIAEAAAAAGRSYKSARQP